jgi:hypothetical protein
VQAVARPVKQAIAPVTSYFVTGTELPPSTSIDGRTRRMSSGASAVSMRNQPGFFNYRQSLAAA